MMMMMKILKIMKAFFLLLLQLKKREEEENTTKIKKFLSIGSKIKRIKIFRVSFLFSFKQYIIIIIIIIKLPFSSFFLSMFSKYNN